MQVIRFARSARRHKIGKASALYVINHYDPVLDYDEKFRDWELDWVGADERNRELHIIAVIKPDCLLVIHVFPTALKRRGRHDEPRV